MKRWLPFVVALVLLAVGLLIWQGKRQVEPSKDPAAQPAAKALAKAAPGRGGAGDMIAPFSREPDAEGTLRLEGVVVDEAGAPVAGAKIWVSSEPKRETTAEDDGSFAFDKLLGRSYGVTAQAGALVGSTMHLLSDKSPPVTIIVKQGATLTVAVTSDEGPIAGARVAVEALAEHAQTTAADGKATLVGVSEGWTPLTVRADGFAAHAEFVEISGKSKEVAVRLKRGAPVRGRVVDEAGAPVEGAKIFAIDASSYFGEIDSQPLAQSDAKGEFTVAAVAPGSYRFRARHADFAAATSSITAVDANGTRELVLLTVKKGIALRGRVVTTDKAAVAYANVSLAGSADGTRSTTALADGTFEFKAVALAAGAEALEKTKLLARSETATSKPLPLAQLAPNANVARDIENLELVVDQVGKIAGTTVDEAGAAVPEASVVAYLDPSKNGGDLMELMTQTATATSDGDGNFVVYGLGDGEYSLSGSRGGQMQWGGLPQNPTNAKTGATGVRVVVPGEGKIVGKVAFADGSAPKSGTARVGWLQNANVVDGAFTLEAVPAGNYALRVKGAGFVEGAKDGVVVKGGETTDVGTIVVERGRTVAGVVRDAKGAPVVGAKVYLGTMIVASGTGIGGSGEATSGEGSTESGGDGTFSFGGIGAKATTVVAEHSSGRSFAVPVAAGTSDERGLVAVIRGYGSMGGTVNAGGKPVEAQVIASPDGELKSISVVNAGADGAFVIERLPEGEYRVTAQTGGGLGNQSGSATAMVRAGKKTTVAIEIPIGDIELTVEVKGKEGAKIDAAQIFLFVGTVAANKGADLMDVFAKASGASMQFWLGAAFPNFAKLRAGNYTVCTIPITGNILDPATQTKINDHAGELAVYCQAHTIAEAPKQQTFTHTVPAMTPLP
ncbi:MAG: carboxypeptidase regulatory-like domain-containing protein [Myxococcales bacterium]|nr:carboxypeptidase regulatory-like domain-containing protein [Myxococcales bacterium]